MSVKRNVTAPVGISLIARESVTPFPRPRQPPRRARRMTEAEREDTGTRWDWRYRAARDWPRHERRGQTDRSATHPGRVARLAGNASHGPEHAHELTERLRVGETSGSGSSRPEKAHSD